MNKDYLLKELEEDIEVEDLRKLDLFLKEKYKDFLLKNIQEIFLNIWRKKL